MHDLEIRLIKCFKAVFPELGDEEVKRASLSSVADWDSVATVALVTLIEEEFGVQIPIEDLENVVSFPLVLDQLRRENHVGS